MKTIKLTLVTLFFAMTNFVAQSQNDTTVGALVAYGTEIKSIGIGANAEFPIIDKLTIAPSFIYFLPKDEGFVKINWFEVNANANYYFIEQDNLGVYGIAGLNYSSVKTKFEGASSIFGESFDVSDGRFGLNIGGGINFDIGKSIIPFAELKYVIIDGGQLVAAAGVRFKI